MSVPIFDRMEPGPIPDTTILTNDTAAILHEIDLESNSPAWTEKQFENEFLNTHSVVYGTKLKNLIVGFIVCHILDKEAHIVNFGVRISHRGKGFGKKLANYLVEELLRREVQNVTLEVREGNTTAINLYESLGFTRVGIRKKFYSSNGEDALILGLDMGTFMKKKGLAPVI